MVFIIKQIKINNENTTYYINEDGNLYNEKTKKYYKGTIKNGYLIYDLRWKNKKTSFSAHRLVAEYFLNNPNNYPIVNHIDGNKLNNNVNNLEWCSYSYNNQHAIDNGLKQKSMVINEKYINDIPGEEWEYYKDSFYQISNKGRVLNTKTNCLLKSNIKNGYRVVCLQRKTLLVHRLVYSVFYKIEIPDDMVINHINGNKLDNNLENLEMISGSENIKHAYYTLDSFNLPVIMKYDNEFNFIESFKGIKSAALNEGVHESSIKSAIYNRNFSNNYYWCYKDHDNYNLFNLIKITNEKKTKSQRGQYTTKICIYNSNLELVNTFDSVNEAFKKTGISTSVIYANLSMGRFNNGYYWSYIGDNNLSELKYKIAYNEIKDKKIPYTIILKDKNGEIIHIFNTMQEAKLFSNKSTYSIQRLIRSRKFDEGLYWTYKIN